MNPIEEELQRYVQVVDKLKQMIQNIETEKTTYDDRSSYQKGWIDGQNNLASILFSIINKDNAPSN